MKKSDLRSGMIVRLRNGKLYVTMEVEGHLIITNKNSWNPLDNYKEDLTEKNNFAQLDIVEIYRGFGGNLDLMFKVTPEERIWVRNPKQKMTVSQIEKELGYEIEIARED